MAAAESASAAADAAYTDYVRIEGAAYQTYSNAEAAAWDLELDRQTRPIELEWRRLDRERMAREGDAFVIALRRDLIDAADFA